MASSISAAAANHAMTAQRTIYADLVAKAFQGGVLCADEFSTDLAKIHGLDLRKNRDGQSDFSLHRHIKSLRKE